MPGCQAAPGAPAMPLIGAEAAS
ncbi:MAG TPA: hypothetical protein ENK50_04365 [Sedimenticola sp.]|nr:hypothetical protein [Sedimenticola sp.]